MDGDVKPKAAKVAKEEAAFLQEARERLRTPQPPTETTGLRRKMTLISSSAISGTIRSRPRERAWAVPCLTINRLPQFVARGRRYSHQQARD